MTKPNQVVCICGHCHKRFTIKASRHAYGRGKYCSPACFHNQQAVDAISLFKTRIVVRDSGCHEYILDVNEPTYPSVSIGHGKHIAAHRYMWMIENGLIPEDLFVLHTCDNMRCCRIDHLFLGTQQDNMTDKVSKGRQASRANGKINNLKLSADQAETAKEHRRQGRSITQLAEDFNVAWATMHNIVKDISEDLQCL